MSGTGQNYQLLNRQSPEIRVSVLDRDANNGNGRIASDAEIAMLKKMSENLEPQANKLNIRGIEQAAANAERGYRQSSIKTNEISTEAFVYSQKLESQTLQAEVAQNVHQKILNEINQIIYNKGLKREEQELRINQILLGLISGITNLSVNNSDSLTTVMLDGLSASLKFEFHMHSKTPKFIQCVAGELILKLKNIILYLQRF